MAATELEAARAEAAIATVMTVIAVLLVKALQRTASHGLVDAG